METLEKIFGSAAKVKIMRLFLFNPEVCYDINDIAARAKVSKKAARAEMHTLEEISLVKPRVFYKEQFSATGNNSGGNHGHGNSAGNSVKEKRKRVRGWMLDTNFAHLSSLQNFLIHTSIFQPKEIIKKVNRIGKIKLLVVAGVFIQDKESRVDMLIVGDGLKRGATETMIKGIEAELGREIVYSAFETADFKYRLSMFDKLIRDILDYPHKKLIDKLGLDME